MRFDGRVVVVTGAAGGIGGAAVRGFAAEGARVTAVDLAEPHGEQPDPGTVRWVKADVSVPDDVERVYREVDSSGGRLDVLLNAAGASGRSRGDGPVHACTEEAWEWVLRVNLTSVFLMCRGAIPRLQAAGGGCIINVASILALRGHRRFDTHAYAAAKGGIAALGRAMAVRYAGDRIRVCTLCPGLIRTPMSARAQADPEILSELAGLQPLGGDLGSPEDVAGAALFLASDTARFLTGVELPVDGGWSVR